MAEFSAGSLFDLFSDDCVCFGDADDGSFDSAREWQEHPPRFLPDFSRGAPDRVETAAFAGGTSPRSILLDGIFFSGLKHGKHFISRLVLIPLCLRLFQIPNACAPLQFTNRLMPTTRSPTPPPLLSYNPEDSEWQQQG